MYRFFDSICCEWEHSFTPLPRDQRQTSILCRATPRPVSVARAKVKTNQKSTPSSHKYTQLYSIYVCIYIVYMYLYLYLLTADSISATRIWISLFVIRKLRDKMSLAIKSPKRIAWNVVIFWACPCCCCCFSCCCCCCCCCRLWLIN